MYLTHTFSSRESMCLAHNWLTRIGFHARLSPSGMPRLIVVDDPNRLDAARLLMDAAEYADTTGFHSINDQAIPIYPDGDGHGQPRHDHTRPHEPHHAVLSWHPMP
jgi:hypothetical protein